MEIILLQIVMTMGLLHLLFFLGFCTKGIHEEQCYDRFGIFFIFILGPH